MNKKEHYVLDTSFFTVTRYYYADIFPSFWKKFDDLTESEKISSVKEVFKELDKYGGEQKMLKEWLDKNKKLFTRPTGEEQEFLKELFKDNKDYSKSLKKKNQLKGTPWADPYIISKAKIFNATVVTAEKSKSKTIHKIPDVCDKYQIKYLNPNDFLKKLAWKF